MVSFVGCPLHKDQIFAIPHIPWARIVTLILFGQVVLV
jgi:hypothetical protein